MNLKVETLLRIGGPGLVEKARLAARLGLPASGGRSRPTHTDE